MQGDVIELFSFKIGIVQVLFEAYKALMAISAFDIFIDVSNGIVRVRYLMIQENGNNTLRF